MSAPDDALAAILGITPDVRQLIAQENPYGFLQDIGAPAQQLAFQAKDSSLGERAIVSALGGLLSGVGKGFGLDYQNTQEKNYSDVLSGLDAGTPISRPDSMPVSVFQRAQDQANSYKVFQAKTQADLIQKLALADPVGLLRAQAIFPELTGAIKSTTANGVSASSDSSVGGSELGDQLREKAKENLVKYGGNKELELALEKEKAKPWFDKIPAAAKTNLTQVAGVAEEFRVLAERFDAFQEASPAAWADFQSNAYIAGTEANKLYTSLLRKIPAAARLGSEVGNLAAGEQAKILEATLGNATSRPKDIADRIREMSDSNTRIAIEKLYGFKTGYEQGGDALIDRLTQASGGARTIRDPDKTSSSPILKASDLIAKGYTKGPTGWIPPQGAPRG